MNGPEIDETEYVRDESPLAILLRWTIAIVGGVVIGNLAESFLPIADPRVLANVGNAVTIGVIITVLDSWKIRRLKDLVTEVASGLFGALVIFIMLTAIGHFRHD